jgi:hypothetical protein
MEDRRSRCAPGRIPLGSTLGAPTSRPRAKAFLRYDAEEASGPAAPTTAPGARKRSGNVILRRG